MYDMDSQKHEHVYVKSTHADMNTLFASHIKSIENVE